MATESVDKNCCRCNKKGRCIGCHCVKTGKHCLSCLPGRLGKCENVYPTQDQSQPQETLQSLSPDDSGIVTPQPANNDQILHAPGMQHNEESPSPQPTPDTETQDDAPTLPSYQPLASPNFVWGTYDSETTKKNISRAYSEIVHWRRNLFPVPTGNAGTSFVSELAKLYKAYAEGSALECVALKATSIMPSLLLQRPHYKSKMKEHRACLTRRMTLWKEGDIDSLLTEGKTLQRRLPQGRPRQNTQRLARSFANLIFEGKIKPALQMLSKETFGGLLHMEDIVSMDEKKQSVKEILKRKHPLRRQATPSSLIEPNTEPANIHPVIFDQIDAATIRSAALRTNGAAGPSGMDAKGWRRLCTSFKTASNDLCHSLALLTKRLSTTLVDPDGLAPFLACRLIALDKNPGVRPIGVCETARRIVSKAILVVTRGDIQEAAGALQLCAGQAAGAEAVIHATRESFNRDETEAVLLVDASNAFNSLNRQAALHNVRHLCPPIATTLINTYRSPTDLFVDGSSLLSQEGTTQGDPLAMPLYALATIPLIRKLPGNVQQAWYADDATASGNIQNLRSWWNELTMTGLDFGYFPNASKTWLITKPQHLQTATAAFDDTQVNITCAGRPHLGAPLGSHEFIQQFVSNKVMEWCQELETLSTIAVSQPHAAYAAITHGLAGRWTYLSRTTPNISEHLSELEGIIQTKLIPALTGRPPPNEAERDLLALPCRLGGIGLSNPASRSPMEFEASQRIAGPLKTLILDGSPNIPFEAWEEQSNAKTQTHSLRRSHEKEITDLLKPSLPESLKRSMDLAQEKGASSWLTAIPIAEFNFTLHKGAFRDALCLRYGWQPARLPTNCDCGSNFSVEHALSCPKGGFPSIRHNEVRDLTANLLTETCNNVCIEPHLQPVSGEDLGGASANIQEGARLDIAANGLWGGRFERTYFDIRVFNPHAPSNRKNNPSSCYRKHENEKKRTYEKRIREIEHSSFSPIVLSATGGLGQIATATYKRLATLLAEKWKQPYSTTIYWLRCRLCFSLLRSAIQAIRGTRSATGNALRAAPQIDLAMQEALTTLQD